MTCTISLYTAPANSGKTEFTLQLARSAAQSIAQGDVIVCVATNEQLQQWRKRLAQSGGALGIQIYTFERLTRQIIEKVGPPLTLIGEPVQFRLLRQLIQNNTLTLEHFKPIRDKIGLVQEIEALIQALKSSLIEPEALSKLWSNAAPRLRDMSQIYSAYQAAMKQSDWADSAGVGWLANEVLSGNTVAPLDWPLVIFDGFGSFTPLRRTLMRNLARHVPQIVMTLNKEPAVPYTRFNEVIEQLEQLFGVTASPLPPQPDRPDHPLTELCTALFDPNTTAPNCSSAAQLSMVETTTQSAEVRVALRWLKQQHLEHDVPLDEMALVSQDPAAYQPFIQQTAAEFGLPIRFVDGVRLDQNPAIHALINLLKLFLPHGDTNEP